MDTFDQPPDYEEVQSEERQLNGQPKYLAFAKQAFWDVNIMVAMLLVIVVVPVKYFKDIAVHVNDVSSLCDDEAYNFIPQPVLVYRISEYAILLTTISFCTLYIIKANLEKKDAEEIIIKLFIDVLIFIMHLLFLYAFVQTLKATFGIPRPYFFTNETIKYSYCEDTAEKEIVPVLLSTKEGQLRTSFPSLRAASYGFCIAYLFLYLDNLDIQNGVHAAQQLLMLIPGCYIIRVMYQSWLNGENHMSDIVIGLILGILQALMAIRCIFGKVFHHQAYVSTEIRQRIIRTRRHRTLNLAVEYPSYARESGETTFRPRRFTAAQAVNALAIQDEEENQRLITNIEMQDIADTAV